MENHRFSSICVGDAERQQNENQATLSTEKGQNARLLDQDLGQRPFGVGDRRGEMNGGDRWLEPYIIGLRQEVILLPAPS